MEFVDEMVAAQPGLVSKAVIGKSHEGRDIVAVRLGLNSTTTTTAASAEGGGAKPKNSVIVLGGVHAREWASASMVNSIHNFAVHTSSSPRLTAILSTFDIYYIPITNPDGYEYTFTGDRLWRKNRQPLVESMSFNSTRCVGIDINRNFPSGWQPSSRADWALGLNGAGPCGLTYPGSKAAEAIEVKAVMDWAENVLVKEMRANVTAFYDVHAYSQLWMYSPGYSCVQKPHNPSALSSASLRASSAIARFSGARFTTGQICPVLYAAAGCSTDWAYESLKAPYSFAIELSPGRDDGAGFLLPADRIRITAGEMQAGLLASLEEMAGIAEQKEGDEVVPGWRASGNTASSKGEIDKKPKTAGSSGAGSTGSGWMSAVFGLGLAWWVSVVV
ncbi:hypothetical protein BCR44DRAFT_129984 [Catenaria anguillulae PL171]|uniref:Peptidase M14 domain-containing protein n=1 Tax=Catenaria anguillulae PL171 TaxID=765915 RepID=A0A1Y2HHU6_9FUNG|nr:hypothetical protein BCR44DRAFT_129984 [Catenaria anguillulae PL171]